MEALVEFHYVAQEPDELTIRKGDIIKDVKIMSGGWWEGTLRDQRGMFPDNFVKVLETSASGVKNEVSVEAKKESVILRNGSVVNNSALTSSTCSNINNTNGSIITTTTTTTTAAATTISNSSNSSNSSSASSNNNNNNNNNNNSNNSNSNSSSSKWCKVLFSYDPCNEDELGLIPNDMIEYLGQVEEGWWTGRLRGRVGVFPSNFVSPPTTAEDTKELCRVLFAYEAANEDELTLAEGEIVTLISRDAPDKGWWKGELRGKIGLFPDNFVQVLPIKESSYQDDASKAVRPLELNRGLKSSTTTTTTTTSNLKQWNTGKKGEKAYARKSLDTRTTTTIDKKSISPVLASSSSLSLNSLSLSDKKSVNSTSPISPGIKRLIKSEDISTILPIDTADHHHNESIDEELDGVEREEDTPLLHLTASRVKAPRRRLPSSHHRQTTTEIGTVTTNGAIDTVDQSKNDDNDETLSSGKNRQPVAPWIEELKFNQMEKKKILSTDKLDKKDKNQLLYELPVHTADTLEQFQFQDLNQDSQRLIIKDKDSTFSTYQRTNLHAAGPVSPTSGTPPAYVPYRLYSQLLDRVTTLEERQTVLQRMVVQLSEQVGPLLTNSSIIGGNNKS